MALEDQPDGWCAQCAKELGHPAGAYSSAKQDAINKLPAGYFLWFHCTGCGRTSLDGEGNCSGWPCEKHNTTPNWRKLLQRIKSKARYVCGWLSAHTIHRHHILDLRTPRVYDYGWCDVDGKMLYACFNLLKKFVDEEKPFDVTDWTQDEEHKFAANEIHALYSWWVDDYPKLLHESATPFQDSELLAKEEEMLVRLVKIRKFLWT